MASNEQHLLAESEDEHFEEPHHSSPPFKEEGLTAIKIPLGHLERKLKIQMQQAAEEGGEKGKDIGPEIEEIHVEVGRGPDINEDDDDDDDGSAQHAVLQKPPSFWEVLKGSRDFEEQVIKEERRRLKVVWNASVVAFLGPISTTVYTPVIPIIQKDLETSQSEVMATVSSYLLVSGVMPLLWGPFSDRFGRKTAFIISTIIFTAFSLACAFAWNINALLAFRVLAAVGASSTLTVGAGAIADTHHPSVRGKAMGYFLLGPLLGPVIGPTIGGFLGQYLGWKSIFYFLAAMGGVALAFLFFFMPETLPKSAPGTKRPFPKPWAAFFFLLHPGILSVTVMAAISYASFYVFVVSFPTVMSSVFTMSTRSIGLSMIISGVGTLLGSVIGGRVADYAAKGRGVIYRLTATVIGQVLFIPVVLVVGWTFEVHPAYPIILGFFNGFLFTFPRPGLTTYAIEVGGKFAKQQSASTISGLIYACMYALGGVTSQISVLGRAKLGTGWFFTILSVACFLSLIPVVIVTILGIKKAKQIRASKTELLKKKANT